MSRCTLVWIVPTLLVCVLAVACAQQPKAVVTDDPPPRLERIRKAKMPKIEKPVMFDTPEADAILSALEVFPPDNPWNLVVEDWPVHANSQKIVNSMGANKPFRYNSDMGFILIPSDQKKIDVKVVNYPD